MLSVDRTCTLSPGSSSLCPCLGPPLVPPASIVSLDRMGFDSRNSTSARLAPIKIPNLETSFLSLPKANSGQHHKHPAAEAAGSAECLGNQTGRGWISKRG